MTIRGRGGWWPQMIETLCVQKSPLVWFNVNTTARATKPRAWLLRDNLQTTVSLFQPSVLGVSDEKSSYANRDNGNRQGEWYFQSRSTVTRYCPYLRRGQIRHIQDLRIQHRPRPHRVPTFRS